MLVFWDIDGTLLTTDRAGIYAWQDALREISGASVDLASFDTAGHPDFGIARRLLVEYGDSADPEASTIEQLVRRYEDHLPAALHRRTGRVLPNVREVLELLARSGARSLLLTGNTRRGAAAKLAHYGLAHFFSDGAFSEGDRDRAAIARAAIERAGASGSGFDADRVYVVGDTPHDIACAGAIGARAVAVATGAYDSRALTGAGAWRVLPQLPAAAEFLGLLAGRGVAADA